MAKRQTTRWHYRATYSNGKKLNVGVIHNPDLKIVNHIRDVIRIKSQWIEENDIDWAIRPDEAMDLVEGLATAVADVMGREEIVRQKVERA